MHVSIQVVRSWYKMGAAGSQSQGGSAIGGKAGTRNPVYFFSHSLTPPNHRPAVSAMVNTAAAPPVSSVGSHRCVGTCTHKVACDSRGGVRALLASDPEAAPPPNPHPHRGARIGTARRQAYRAELGGARRGGVSPRGEQPAPPAPTEALVALPPRDDSP